MSHQTHTQSCSQTQAETQVETRSDDSSLRRGLVVLAMLLAALVALRAGRVGPESVAYADMVADSGSYTAMTTRTGAEELLYLVDDRSETLMVYRVINGRTVDLVDRQSLPQMFGAARAAWLGTQPGRARP